jgi:hypothetical protein
MRVEIERIKIELVAYHLEEEQKKLDDAKS